MRPFAAIGLLLVGLILAFSGVQRAEWNTVTGRHDFVWGLDNPVALVAGVAAFAAGIWLLVRRPTTRTDRDEAA